jgi:hypothetical protein
MNKRFVGKVIFWLGILFLIYAFAGNYIALPGFRNFMARGGTSEAGNTVDMDVIIGAIKTITWLFSFQLGIIFTVIGTMFYQGIAAKHIRRFAVIGLFYLIFAGLPPVLEEPISAVFVVTGTGILILLPIAIWYWAQRRSTLSGSLATIADLNLLGYAFFAFATWNVCGLGSVARILHPEQVQLFGTQALINTQMTKIVIEFALAWLFICLAQRKAWLLARQARSLHSEPDSSPLTFPSSPGVSS